MKKKINRIFFFLIIIQIHFLFAKTNQIGIENGIQENKNSFFIVKNIKIIGKTKYDPIFISNLSHLSIGDKIEIPGKKIDDIIKELWKSNLFKKISIFYKKDRFSSKENEIDLLFDLEDSIEIHKINIKGTGITQFDTVQKIREGEKISYDLIQSLHNEIKDYYLKKGYKEIYIKKNILFCKKKKNILNLSVRKGKKTFIESILFDGNKILSQKMLMSLMTKTRNKFYIPIIEKPFLFVDEKIKDDLKNIREKYFSMGFLDAKVILDTIWKEESGNYSIKIKVIEGNQYSLGDVNFIGNTVFKTDFLRKILVYKKGDPYDKIGINNNISNSDYAYSIISNYLDRGYFFAKIVPIETKIDNKNQVHLEIKIEENHPVYIKKVNISGNTITKDHVIRRELTTSPGDLLSPKEIKSSLLRLVNLNLFETNKIYPYIKPNKEHDRVDIEWHVVEKGSNQIKLHGGYEKGKLLGNLKLSFGNFSLLNFLKWNWNPIPQGEGQKLLLFSQFGKDKKSYGLSFTEPWIEKKNPTSLTFETYFSKNKIKNDKSFFPKNEEIFLEKIGSSIYWDKFLTFLDPYSKIRLSTCYDKFFYKKSHSDPFLRLNNLNYLISFQRFYGDPDLIYPIDGSKIQVDTIFTLPYSLVLKNKNKNQLDWMEFFKIKMVSYWYKKIVDQMVIKVGGEFGILGNNEKNYFSFHKFSMGGNKLEDRDHISLRGYSDHEDLTPNDGGIIYNKSLFEIRYLIKSFSNENENLSKFWTSFFLEGGSISDSYKKFNPFKMNKSFGVGFRMFFSPIGFFGIDFGHPIIMGISSNNEEGKDHFKSKWKTHFIIGQD
ncbi:BamA/OMP85 family outer membrane protein [Blattabacterium cuenoti]|uniref:BamA/OMP85 family outer membrane protein n=1 Tax=Blattabacterium cuenoti TaxID=1653831 RepID=UPI00163B7C90|nr:POTRA domain-containing protein [Blattabacterium cuenoti]